MLAEQLAATQAELDTLELSLRRLAADRPRLSQEEMRSRLAALEEPAAQLAAAVERSLRHLAAERPRLPPDEVRSHLAALEKLAAQVAAIVGTAAPEPGSNRSGRRRRMRDLLRGRR